MDWKLKFIDFEEIKVFELKGTKNIKSLKITDLDIIGLLSEINELVDGKGLKDKGFRV